MDLDVGTPAAPGQTAGFLNLRKPPGLTSHDVVAAVRRRLRIKRVGHAGTLDPLATGVLPVAVGAFTRLLPYLDGTKAYRALIAFGRATATADAAGETIAEAPVDFEADALRTALLGFVGTILQRPPAFSAIHVQGRRAYELAREGIAVEIPPRQIEIGRIELLGFWSRFEEPLVGADASLIGTDPALGPRALIEVDCAAGTYIRSLAEDIGAALGTRAFLASLVRTRAGTFALSDALPLAADVPWTFTPPERALAHLAVREVDPQEAVDLRLGRSIAAPGLSGIVRAMAGPQIVAIGQAQGDLLRPKTVLPIHQPRLMADTDCRV